MDTKEAIKKLLAKIWETGRVNSTKIYKGYGRYGYGWYCQQFGHEAEHLGNTSKDAIATVERMVAHVGEYCPESLETELKKIFEVRVPNPAATTPEDRGQLVGEYGNYADAFNHYERLGQENSNVFMSVRFEKIK